MKILALDIGDKWVGIAISDSSHQHSFPSQTTTSIDLEKILIKTVSSEDVGEIVYGLPYTLRGEEGSQLKKVVAKIEQIKLVPGFKSIKWIGIDERFSSQGAMNVIHQQNKKIGDNKQKEHSIVAALLLQSYLDGKNRRNE